MSTYTRKTVDEYEIQGDYGLGWEMLTTEETGAAAREMLLCYQCNEPRARHRIKRKRVPIEEVTPDQSAGVEPDEDITSPGPKWGFGGES